MLKIFKRKSKDNYLFITYKEEIKDEKFIEFKGEIVYYGIEYHRNEKRITLINGNLLDRNKYLKEIELYELVFNGKNILEEMKKKIKRRIKFLNKKNQSDFNTI